MSKKNEYEKELEKYKIKPAGVVGGWELWYKNKCLYVYDYKKDAEYRRNKLIEHKLKQGEEENE